MQKVCTKCKKTKSLKDFHKSSCVKDGRRSDCKECVRTRQLLAYHNKSKEDKNKHNYNLCPSCNKKKSRYAVLCHRCARPFDPESPTWRKDHHGYMVAIGGNGRQISQHRFLIEKHIGRKLMKHENVHHKNGIKDDNRIENLELWSTSQPSGQRVEDKIAWCLQFLSLYMDTKV